MLYIDWQTLNDLLKGDVLEVTFEEEGDDRVIRCTLREDMLPPKNKNENVQIPDYYTAEVYDLDGQEYRNFPLAAVKLIRLGEWN